MSRNQQLNTPQQMCLSRRDRQAPHFVLNLDEVLTQAGDRGVVATIQQQLATLDYTFFLRELSSAAQVSCKMRKRQVDELTEAAEKSTVESLRSSVQAVKEAGGLSSLHEPAIKFLSLMDEIYSDRSLGNYLESLLENFFESTETLPNHIFLEKKIQLEYLDNILASMPLEFSRLVKNTVQYKGHSEGVMGERSRASVARGTLITFGQRAKTWFNDDEVRLLESTSEVKARVQYNCAKKTRILQENFNKLNDTREKIQYTGDIAWLSPAGLAELAFCYMGYERVLQSELREIRSTSDSGVDSMRQTILQMIQSLQQEMEKLVFCWDQFKGRSVENSQKTLLEVWILESFPGSKLLGGSKSNADLYDSARMSLESEFQRVATTDSFMPDVDRFMPEMRTCRSVEDFMTQFCLQQGQRVSILSQLSLKLNEFDLKAIKRIESKLEVFRMSGRKELTDVQEQAAAQARRGVFKHLLMGEFQQAKAELDHQVRSLKLSVDGQASGLISSDTEGAIEEDDSLWVRALSACGLDEIMEFINPSEARKGLAGSYLSEDERQSIVDKNKSYATDKRQRRSIYSKFLKVFNRPDVRSQVRMVDNAQRALLAEREKISSINLLEYLDLGKGLDVDRVLEGYMAKRQDLIDANYAFVNLLHEEFDVADPAQKQIYDIFLAKVVKIETLLDEYDHAVREKLGGISAQIVEKDRALVVYELDRYYGQFNSGLAALDRLNGDRGHYNLCENLQVLAGITYAYKETRVRIHNHRNVPGLKFPAAFQNGWERKLDDIKREIVEKYQTAINATAEKIKLMLNTLKDEDFGSVETIVKAFKNLANVSQLLKSLLDANKALSETGESGQQEGLKPLIEIVRQVLPEAEKDRILLILYKQYLDQFVALPDPLSHLLDMTVLLESSLANGKYKSKVVELKDLLVKKKFTFKELLDAVNFLESDELSEDSSARSSKSQVSGFAALLQSVRMPKKAAADQLAIQEGSIDRVNYLYNIFAREGFDLLMPEGEGNRFNGYKVDPAVKAGVKKKYSDCLQVLVSLFSSGIGADFWNGEGVNVRGNKLNKNGLLKQVIPILSKSACVSFLDMPTDIVCLLQTLEGFVNDDAKFKSNFNELNLLTVVIIPLIRNLGSNSTVEVNVEQRCNELEKQILNKYYDQSCVVKKHNRLVAANGGVGRLSGKYPEVARAFIQSRFGQVDQGLAKHLAGMQSQEVRVVELAAPEAANGAVATDEIEIGRDYQSVLELPAGTAFADLATPQYREQLTSVILSYLLSKDRADEVWRDHSVDEFAILLVKLLGENPDLLRLQARSRDGADRDLKYMEVSLDVRLIDELLGSIQQKMPDMHLFGHLINLRKADVISETDFISQISSENCGVPEYLTIFPSKIISIGNGAEALQSDFEEAANKAEIILRQYSCTEKQTKILSVILSGLKQYPELFIQGGENFSRAGDQYVIYQINTQAIMRMCDALGEYDEHVLSNIVLRNDDEPSKKKILLQALRKVIADCDSSTVMKKLWLDYLGKHQDFITLTTLEKFCASAVNVSEFHQVYVLDQEKVSALLLHDVPELQQLHDEVPFLLDLARVTEHSGVADQGEFSAILEATVIQDIIVRPDLLDKFQSDAGLSIPEINLSNTLPTVNRLIAELQVKLSMLHSGDYRCSVPGLSLLKLPTDSLDLFLIEGSPSDFGQEYISNLVSELFGNIPYALKNILYNVFCEKIKENADFRPFDKYVNADGSVDIELDQSNVARLIESVQTELQYLLMVHQEYSQPDGDDASLKGVQNLVTAENSVQSSHARDYLDYLSVQESLQGKDSSYFDDASIASLSGRIGNKSFQEKLLDIGGKDLSAGLVEFLETAIQNQSIWGLDSTVEKYAKIWGGICVLLVHGDSFVAANRGLLIGLFHKALDIIIKDGFPSDPSSCWWISACGFDDKLKAEAFNAYVEEAPLGDMSISQLNELCKLLSYYGLDEQIKEVKFAALKKLAAEFQPNYEVIDSIMEEMPEVDRQQFTQHLQENIQFYPAAHRVADGLDPKGNQEFYFWMLELTNAYGQHFLKEDFEVPACFIELLTKSDRVSTEKRQQIFNEMPVATVNQILEQVEMLVQKINSNDLTGLSELQFEMFGSGSSVLYEALLLNLLSALNHSVGIDSDKVRLLVFNVEDAFKPMSQRVQALPANQNNKGLLLHIAHDLEQIYFKGSYSGFENYFTTLSDALVSRGCDTDTFANTLKDLCKGYLSAFSIANPRQDGRYDPMIVLKFFTHQLDDRQDLSLNLQLKTTAESGKVALIANGSQINKIVDQPKDDTGLSDLCREQWYCLQNLERILLEKYSKVADLGSDQWRALLAVTQFTAKPQTREHKAWMAIKIIKSARAKLQTAFSRGKPDLGQLKVEFQGIWAEVASEISDLAAELKDSKTLRADHNSFKSILLTDAISLLQSNITNTASFDVGSTSVMKRLFSDRQTSGDNSSAVSVVDAETSRRKPYFEQLLDSLIRPEQAVDGFKDLIDYVKAWDGRRGGYQDNLSKQLAELFSHSNSIPVRDAEKNIASIARRNNSSSRIHIVAWVLYITSKGVAISEKDLVFIESKVRAEFPQHSAFADLLYAFRSSLKAPASGRAAHEVESESEIVSTYIQPDDIFLSGLNIVSQDELAFPVVDAALGTYTKQAVSTWFQSFSRQMWSNYVAAGSEGPAMDFADAQHSVLSEKQRCVSMHSSLWLVLGEAEGSSELRQISFEKLCSLDFETLQKIQVAMCKELGEINAHAKSANTKSEVDGSVLNGHGKSLVEYNMLLLLQVMMGKLLDDHFLAADSGFTQDQLDCFMTDLAKLITQFEFFTFEKAGPYRGNGYKDLSNLRVNCMEVASGSIRAGLSLPALFELNLKKGLARKISKGTIKKHWGDAACIQAAEYFEQFSMLPVTGGSVSVSLQRTPVKASRDSSGQSKCSEAPRSSAMAPFTLFGKRAVRNIDGSPPEQFLNRVIPVAAK